MKLESTMIDVVVKLGKPKRGKNQTEVELGSSHLCSTW